MVDCLFGQSTFFIHLRGIMNVIDVQIYYPIFLGIPLPSPSPRREGLM
jgi:hypothetical protein